MKARVAFSGSGFLAPIHIGAICAFKDLGIEIIETAGSSGGSIASALVAIGKTAEEMKALALQDIPKGIVSYDITALFKEGFNDGEILLDWLNNVIGPITFGELPNQLTVMATDIDSGKSCKFSNQDTPDVKVADACRASSSVPFVFAPYTVAGIKCVDAGVANNLPVDRLILDDVQRYGIDVLDGEPAGTTNTVIGLAKQCIATMLAANENNLIAWAQQTDSKIVSVSALPYGFLNPSLSLEEKTDLFERGYDAVINFFKDLYGPATK